MSRRHRCDYEHLLKPSPTLSRSLVDRVLDVAVAYQWTVERSWDGRWLAKPHQRTILAPGMTTEADAADFLHEGAHIEDRTDRSDVCMIPSEDGREFSFSEEADCWRFAIQKLGFRWSGAMQRHMEHCLATYARLARTIYDLEPMERVIAEGAQRARGVVVRIRA